MKYIWQGYSSDTEFYVAERPLSPYLEVGYTGGNKIGVNIIPRFYEIFVHNGRDFERLENCLLHYLAQLDLKSGVHYSSIIEHRLDSELRAGDYGRRAREIYLSLDEWTRRRVLIYLQRHESAQGRRDFFFDAVLRFFPAAKFYFREWDSKFLICIPTAATDLVELLAILLLDIGIEYEIFWNSHFGIIGNAETMKLDELVIY